MEETKLVAILQNKLKNAAKTNIGLHQRLLDLILWEKWLCDEINSLWFNY
jgi:hypothetical protein